MPLQRNAIQVSAITLDLDDTLWPFAPIGMRVEQVLHDWLATHCPRTAERFPAPRMRDLRDQVNAEHPHLVHDFSTMRLITLQRAMRQAGDDPAQAEIAFEVFFAERNRVEFYPDALPALPRLAARVPLAALSNGNADLARVGIARALRLPARRARTWRAQAEREHLPRRLLALGRGLVAGVARRRRCRDGRHWRRPRGPAHLLAQPRASGVAARRRASRTCSSLR